MTARAITASLSSSVSSRTTKLLATSSALRNALNIVNLKLTSVLLSAILATLVAVEHQAATLGEDAIASVNAVLTEVSVDAGLLIPAVAASTDVAASAATEASEALAGMDVVSVNAILGEATEAAGAAMEDAALAAMGVSSILTTNAVTKENAKRAATKAAATHDRTTEMGYLLLMVIEQ